MISCIRGLSQPCCPSHADTLRACSGPPSLSHPVSSRPPPPEPLLLEGSLSPAGMVAGVVALRTEQGQPTPVPLGASWKPPSRSLRSVLKSSWLRPWARPSTLGARALRTSERGQCQVLRAGRAGAPQTPGLARLKARPVGRPASLTTWPPGLWALCSLRLSPQLLWRHQGPVSLKKHQRAYQQSSLILDSACTSHLRRRWTVQERAVAGTESLLQPRSPEALAEPPPRGGLPVLSRPCSFSYVIPALTCMMLPPMANLVCRWSFLKGLYLRGPSFHLLSLNFPNHLAQCFLG